MSLVWVISYVLKHNISYGGYNQCQKELIQLSIDYFITFGYCIGTSLVTIYFASKELNKKAKHLFYGTLTILNLSIVSAYVIDLLADSIFGTTKVIYVIILTTIISLCIYLFSDKS